MSGPFDCIRSNTSCVGGYIIPLLNVQVMATLTIAKATSVPEPKSLPHNPDVKPSLDTKDTIDIEHVPVDDDPRQWSRARKVRSRNDALNCPC